MPPPLAANIVDAAALIDELARFRVVDAARLTNLLAEFTDAGPIALADYLIRSNVLTVFQAERALAGEARMLALGPYRLTDLAGIGTFGPLFTATHTSKPGMFAVRVLPLRSLWKAKQAKQLARTLASGVNHPGVVPLLETDSANGFHYLVWPYTECVRLSDRVTTSGPLAPAEVAALLGHLANALSVCHARQAMHGAITPHSIAVRNNGLPLVLELGAGALLAQNLVEDESLFDTMSSAMASANVLAYAAPELAADPNTLTAEIDQYALGAVGYFALTGLRPYPHPTLSEQLRAKYTAPPPSAAIVNPVVPGDLAAVLERMMSPVPANRFARLEDVEQALAAIAAAEPQQSEHELMWAVPQSELQKAREPSGLVPRSRDGGLGAIRPVQRDDSDASVSFDLPEALPYEESERPASPIAAHQTGAATPGFAHFPTRTPAPAASVPPALASAAGSQAKVVGRALDADETDTHKTIRDPRLATPTPPVLWHTTRPTNAASDEASAHPDGAPPPTSVLWRKVKRNLMFWQAATDVVQVSVFGPTVTPGQTVNLTVFLHTPDAIASVLTLSRAFMRDAEPVGTGYLTCQISRGSELKVHLSVANAGVGKALLDFEWRGQPQRLNFDLHVPWESPEGTSPGLVSVGLDNVRVGKIEFGLNVRPRKA